MMVCCAESSKPDYSKILSISSVSYTFTILILSPIFSFSLLGQFQINLNYNIILSTAISRQLDVRKHMRRLWLPFFIILCFLFQYWYLFGDSFVRFSPVGTHDWCVCPSSTIRVGWKVLIFSRNHKLSLYCQHTKLQVMKYLSQLYHKIALVYFSCWTSALLLWCSLWTMDLINLVNLDVVST